jgi:geranylgeranyl diphosphate synthase type I
MKFVLSDFEAEVCREVDAELQRAIQSVFPNQASDLNEIFLYHLGLETQTGKKGKRIRPILTALCTAGAGQDWRKSLPAACAIELIHNFSLIHDDIEDNGDMRRGKPAVWKKWGLAKGINAGDAMFAAAFDVLSSNKGLNDQLTLNCIHLLAKTCIALTEGQQLDIDYETRELISPDEYFQMIKGKTATLISCCTETGALIGELDEENRRLYRSFGENLGIAFQILDDWLGIWGDPAVTGKSINSDLLEKKKSYPVVLGVLKSKRFHEKWVLAEVQPDEIPLLTAWLEQDGIKAKVEEEIRYWTKKAQQDLETMDCIDDLKMSLNEFANHLLNRKK